MQISLRQDHSIELICLEKLVFVQFVGDTLLFGDRFEPKKRSEGKTQLSYFFLVCLDKN